MKNIVLALLVFVTCMARVESSEKIYGNPAREGGRRPGSSALSGVSLPGNALSFDGSNDYVDCGNNSSLQITGNALTLEAWIKADAWKSNVWEGGIVVKEGSTTGYMLRCGAGGKVDFNLGDGSWHEALSGAVMTTGRWYHIAGVYNGSTMLLYIDGRLQASASFSGSIGTTTTHVAVGTSAQYLTRTFAGEIDEVRIWNIARTQTQIQQTMNDTLTGAESGLAAYYRFDNGAAGGTNTSDITLTDLTANGNTGSLLNFALTGATSNWVASYAMVQPMSAAATNIGAGSFTANWSAPSLDTDPTGYRIDVAADSNFTTYATGDSDLDAGKTLSWIVSGLTGPQYYYRVRSYNSGYAGASQNSPFQTVSIYPTTQANHILTGNFGQDRLTIDWTDGNGDGRAVFIKQSNSGQAAPQNYTTYTAGTAFGSGAQIGSSGWYCVFSGTTHSGGVTVTNLLPGSYYTVEVFEYKSVSSGPVYNPNTVPTNPVVTSTAMTPAPGNALSFDGANDYVAAPDNDSLDLSTAYTLEAWIKISTLQYSGIISKFQTSGSNGYFLRLKSASPYNQIDFDGLVGGPTLSTGIWYHIAGVKRSDGSRLLYVNGTEYTLSGSATVAANADSLKIGSDLSARFFAGKIDEVRIWRKARTQSEIQSTMGALLSGAESGLAAYYRFDLGSPNGSNSGFNTLTDFSGNHLNGILRNFALTGTSSNWVLSGALQSITQAKNITFSSIKQNKVTLNFTDGGGSHRAVFMAHAVAGYACPPDSTSYSADTTFGSGSQIGTTGWYCVFNGTTHASGVTVSNLNAGYNYRLMVLEFTGSAGTERYDREDDSNNPVNVSTDMPAPGNALSFSGDSAYVTCGNGSNLSITNNITLEAWINASAWKTNVYEGTIIAKDGGGACGYLLRCGAGGALNFTIGANSQWYQLTTKPILKTGEWHHVAGVFDGWVMRVFIDGIALDSSGWNGAFGTTSRPLLIGADPYVSGRTFAGKIDEVRIWNVSKTGGQLMAAMYSELSGNEAGLVAYYKFNEGSPAGSNPGLTTLMDMSGNGNMGTLVNFDLSGAKSNWITSYAMARPGMNAATSISTTSFTANWSAPSMGVTPTKYYLDVASDTEFTAMLPDYTNLDVGNTLSRAITGLTGTYYFYRARCAVDSTIGISTTSAEQSVQLAGAPTRATNIVFSNIGPDSMTIDWTDGGGDKRAVFVTEKPTGSALPQAGITYAANTSYTQGDEIGTSGWFCVFNGATHPGGITVTAMDPGKTVRVIVCEYTGTAGSERYVNAPAANNPNSAATTSGGFDLVTGTSFDGFVSGTIAWVDFNNDGLLDFMVNGDDGGPYAVNLYRNNGDGTFTHLIPAAFPHVTYSSASWGDYNKDGLPDLLLAGRILGTASITRVYRNNGDGTFTDITGNSLTGIQYAAVAWGDYDNDGFPDILITGNNGSSDIAKVYHNNGDGTFTEKPSIALTGVENGSVAWGDFDNDGYLDILITGSWVSKVYRNNGNGTFTEQVNAGLPPLTYSTGVWGDYDNDGYPDILLAGDASENVVVCEVYHNNGDGTFTKSFSQSGGGMAPAVAWGDYNNDGKLDFVFKNNSAMLYRNNGDGTFTQTGAALPFYYDGVCQWGDYDNDGKLDLLLCGDTDDDTFESHIVKNNLANVNTSHANTSPSAPALPHASVSSQGVTLSWAASTDDHTPQNGLTYNLRMGTAPGAINTFSPSANITSGVRRMPAPGNLGQQRNSATLTGLHGTYYWSVQAIDNSYRGSGFSAEQSFTINNPTTQAGNIVYTTIDSNDVTLNWTDGNGSARAVFVKQVSNGIALPDSATTYAANTHFGSGSQIGSSGWYCVFNGTTHSGGVTVTGLTTGTVYRFAVCEYNGAAGHESYSSFQTFANPLTVTTAMIPMGNALSFDGVDDNVNCGTSTTFNIKKKITIEAWINASAWKTNVYEGSIVVKDDGYSTGYMLRCGNNGTLDFNFGDSYNWRELTTAAIMKTGQWYHVAAVYDSTAMKVYINGALKASYSLTDTISPGAGALMIGTSPAYPSRTFAGIIDEVRIWNIARSAADIQNNMYKELTGSETGLVAYYRFNEGVPGGSNDGVTTLFDATSNRNNGTLNSFSLSGLNSNWVATYAAARPTIAAASNIQAYAFTANWTAPSFGATPQKYTIDVATDSSFSTLLSGCNNADAGSGLSTKVSGLSANTTYFYRVRAFGDSVRGLTVPSNGAKVKTTLMILASRHGAGTISPSDSVYVAYDSSKTFTMAALPGSRVDSVLVDGTSVGAPSTYTLNDVRANHTIRAYFLDIPHKIIATVGSHGSVSPADTVTVSYGEDATLNMAPDSGYHTDSVYVNGVYHGSMTTYTFRNVIGDSTLRVTFAPNRYRLIAIAGVHGSIAPAETMYVSFGLSQRFVITPDTGYHIDGVLVDGSKVDSTAGYTFTAVSTNHTIRAVFAINLYPITTEAGPHGTFFPSGTVSAPYGSSQRFVPVADSGYHVDSVFADGVSKPDSLSGYTFINVNASHTIRAAFRISPVTITVAVSDRWNMVSLPVAPSSAMKSSLYSASATDAYWFDASRGYISYDTLQTGRAYWLKFNSAADVSMTGMPCDTLSIPLMKGWNMIGALRKPIAVADLATPTDSLTLSDVFGYSHKYSPIDSMYPGRGYWIKANRDGELVLATRVLAAKVRHHSLNIVNTAELPPPPPDDNIAKMELPKEFSLSQNYPNPFNPATSISYALPARARVLLKLYNTLGQEVATLVDEEEEPGYKSVRFDLNRGAGMPSGTYWYRLTAARTDGKGTETFTEVRKMLLMK